MIALPPIVVSVAAAVPRARAFELFVQRFGEWWPEDYTWSGSALSAIGIQPVAGGACYEIGPHGFRCDWGRVLELEPPERIRWSWQIAPSRAPEPDAACAGEVSVAFDEAGSGCTRVTLEHAHFERHGDGSEAPTGGRAGSAGSWHRSRAGRGARAGGGPPRRCHVWVGTDDEAGRTSVGGVELYPNVLEKLSPLRNPGGHPARFLPEARFRAGRGGPGCKRFGPARPADGETSAAEGAGS